MHISLHTSTTKQEIGAFTSPNIPQSGDFINLDSCLFQVISICYQVTNQESNHANITVQPINDAARQRIGKALLKAL
jgi:hypothetical protein